MSSKVSSPSDMSGTLYPTISRLNPRYSRTIRPRPRSQFLVSPPNSQSSLKALPRYLPPHWSYYVQPEGQLYFLHDFAFRIVTEANVYDPEIKAKVEHWAAHIESQMVETDIICSSEWELYLEIDGTDCFYYFVDHRLQTLFWLVNVDIQDYGVGAADSQSHMDLIMKALYWTHVEFFPMHIGGLSLQCLDEVIGVFTHGFIDRMTSEGSTFPYSKEDCEKFINILKLAREHHTDGYQTCVVARLQTQVYYTRYDIRYGESNPRLSRDTASVDHKMSPVISRLSFGQADRHADELNVMYIDEIVYADAWRKFLSSHIQEWKNTFVTTSLTSMLHLLLLLAPGLSYLTLFSIVLFISSAATSLLLIHRYQLLERSACAAKEHLQSIRSNTRQFQLVALSYSLPSVLHIWGTIVLVINCIASIFLHFGFLPAIISGCFVSMLFMFLWMTISDFQLLSILPQRRKEKCLHDIV